MIHKKYFLSLILVALAFTFQTGQSNAGGHRADGTFAGNQTYVIIGPDAALTDGDYINDNAGLNDNHHYYIEVPVGVDFLRVDLFDADVAAGGNEAALGLDLTAGGNLTYQLRSPAGILLDTDIIGSNILFHNQWVPVSVIPLPAPGHWEVQISQSGGARNSYGIRAFETDPISIDTELNVYWHMGSHGFTGDSTNNRSRTWREYPYIRSGCDCVTNDFDYDINSSAGGTIQLTSRTGGFVSPVVPAGSTSGNGTWNTENFSGWTSRVFSGEYGIWALDLTLFSLTNGSRSNWSTFYMLYDDDTLPARDTPNPASVEPVGNVRVYLPTDANTAPLKPYFRQFLDSPVLPSDPNPLQPGVTTRVRVTIEVVNPTPRVITFSTSLSRTITAFIPSEGGRNTYQGISFIQPGSSLVSQPVIGGSNDNIVWDPGVVLPGTSEVLSYFVDVTPTAPNQTTLLTGTVNSNGTRAFYYDETANLLQPLLQPRSDTSFGPLCELSIVSQDTVLDVTLTEFRAIENERNGGNDVIWKTAEELGTVGFNVHRYNTTDKAGFVPGDIVGDFVPANGSPITTGSYLVTDTEPLEEGEVRAYFLQEIELDGSENFYGPTFVSKILQAPSSVENWIIY